MDKAVARTRLGNMVAATARPALSETDLDALLDAYRTVDSLGRTSADEGWEGGYNLNAAAAEGWRWKAGRVAGDFSFSADDASYSKDTIMAKCLEIEKRYASLDLGALQVQRGPGDPVYDSPRLIL